ARHAPAVPLQKLLEGGALSSTGRGGEKRSSLGHSLGGSEAEVRRDEHVSRRDQNGTLDPVEELADVAGPRVLAHRALRVARDGPVTAARSGRKLPECMPRQEGDVLRTVTQPRDRELDHVEPEVGVP